MTCNNDMALFKIKVREMHLLLYGMPRVKKLRINSIKWKETKDDES